MVFRIEKNKNYTTMSNYHLMDKNLTFKAKGLLSMMLSLPDDWDYSIRGLEKISLESKNTINKILKELEQYGYLERKRIYCNGKISKWEYYVYEKPNLQRENLDPKNQDLENEDLENWDVNKITKELNTKENNIIIRGSYPTLEFTKGYVENNQGVGSNLPNKDYSIKDYSNNNNNTIIREVIEYMNICGEYEGFSKVVKFRYKPTSNYIIKIIKARINEGYTLDDFKDVIYNCYKKFVVNEFEGLNKKSSIQYYNPENIFTSQKMVKYLNEYDNT